MGKPLSTDVQAAAIIILARATTGCDGMDGGEVEDGGGSGDADEEGTVQIRMAATCDALRAALRLGVQAQGKMTPEDARAGYQVCTRLTRASLTLWSDGRIVICQSEGSSQGLGGWYLVSHIQCRQNYRSQCFTYFYRWLVLQLQRLGSCITCAAT